MARSPPVLSAMKTREPCGDVRKGPWALYDCDAGTRSGATSRRSCPTHARMRAMLLQRLRLLHLPVTLPAGDTWWAERVEPPDTRRVSRANSTRRTRPRVLSLSPNRRRVDCGEGASPPICRRVNTDTVPSLLPAATSLRLAACAEARVSERVPVHSQLNEPLIQLALALPASQSAHPLPLTTLQ